MSLTCRLGRALLALAFGLFAATASLAAARSGTPRFDSLPRCAEGQPGACQEALPAPSVADNDRGLPEGLSFTVARDLVDVAYVNHDAAFRFGDAPYLCCDLHTFLDKRSDGVWRARLHVPELERAAIQLVILNLSRPGPLHPLSYVGAKADHALVRTDAPPVVTRLTIDSEALHAPRDIFILRGKSCRASVSGCTLVYFADGARIDTLLQNGPAIPPAVVDSSVFVGLASAPGTTMTDDRRGAELLLGRDAAAFDAFEAFLVRDVIPKIEGAGRPRMRIVGGASDGGSWAGNMALRHPDLFAGAMMFSPGLWSPPSALTAETPLGPPVFWVAGGTLEGSLFRNTQRSAAALAALGLPVCQHYLVGGHTDSTWAADFWWAIGGIEAKAAGKSPC